MQLKKNQYKYIASFVINEISKKHHVTFYNITDTNILHIEYGYSRTSNKMYHIDLDDWIQRYRTEKVKKIIENINVTS